MAIRPEVKQLGRNTAVYGFGNIASKLAAFLLIPIYTKYLTTTDVGIIALLEMTEMFLATIIPMGMINALWRILPGTDTEEKRKALSTAYWGIQTIAVVILTVLIFSSDSIAGFLGLGVHGGFYIILTICNIFLFLGGQFLLAMYQYDQKPYHYLFLSVMKFIGILTLTSVLIIYLGYGIYGVLLGKLIVLGLLYIISTVQVLKTAFVAPSKTLWKRMFKYGSPLIVVALITPILTFSDRYFLKLFVSMEQIGIYSIAYKFGMIINMLLVVPMQRGWAPMMYRLGMGKRSQNIYKDLLYYYGFIGCFISLAIIFFGEDILRIATTENYLSGARYIPWIVLAYFINGFRSYFIAGAALHDRTVLLGIAGAISIVGNLLLNYFLIRSYGVMGAAGATTISYLLLVTLIYFTSQRIIPIDWGWSRLRKLFGVSILLFISISYLKIMFPIFAFVISLLGLFGFILIAAATGLIGRKEIHGIKSLILFKRNQ